MNIPLFLLGTVGVLVALLLLNLRTLFYVCPPNRVYIFSGTRRLVAGRRLGYRILKGGNMLRIPFIERVDQLDLTNMIIELGASGAYAKGGVPLNVQGVANVKVAGYEPVLNNAIERFLGKNRAEIMGIAKATLEGSLRGVLATLTPEEINEDRNLFNERLVQEVEQDMTALGLVVDSLKIQNMTDDVRYLDSIGRIRNASLIASARIAEAEARAASEIRRAENTLKEAQAQIDAETKVAQADAERRLIDAQTRRAAVVAEERAAVAALVAQAEAELKVQGARIEQVRKQLEADVIAVSEANCKAMEQRASADVATIVEEGRARADALLKLSEAWERAGPQAREIMVMQKLEPVLKIVTDTIADTKIDKLTVLGGSGGKSDTSSLYLANEQIKEVFGIDIAEKVRHFGGAPGTSGPVEVRYVEASEPPTPPEND
ncbi:MAG: flotillin family protein [Fimbriimonadaceae bacterium]